MPLVGGFSQGSFFSSALTFRRFTIIGSQVLDLHPKRALNIGVSKASEGEAGGYGSAPECKDGKIGDPRENQPINGIVRHDSHMRISRIGSTENSTRSALAEARSLSSTHRGPPNDASPPALLFVRTMRREGKSTSTKATCVGIQRKLFPKSDIYEASGLSAAGGHGGRDADTLLETRRGRVWRPHAPSLDAEEEYIGYARDLVVRLLASHYAASCLTAAFSGQVKPSFRPTEPGRGKRENPEKTRRPEASSGAIHTCEDPGAALQGIEPSLSTFPPPCQCLSHTALAMLTSPRPGSAYLTPSWQCSPHPALAMLTPPRPENAYLTPPLQCLPHHAMEILTSPRYGNTGMSFGSSTPPEPPPPSGSSVIHFASEEAATSNCCKRTARSQESAPALEGQGRHELMCGNIQFPRAKQNTTTAHVANVLVLFLMDDMNLRHAYDDHLNRDIKFAKFKYMCSLCWKNKCGFLVCYIMEGTGVGSISSSLSAGRVRLLGTNVYDAAVNAKDEMSEVQSVCEEGTHARCSCDVEKLQNKRPSALNTDGHSTPATKKSKLVIEGEVGSEVDHKDSINDDYDDSDNVEDDDDSLDVPTYFHSRLAHSPRVARSLPSDSFRVSARLHVTFTKMGSNTEDRVCTTLRPNAHEPLTNGRDTCRYTLPRGREFVFHQLQLAAIVGGLCGSVVDAGGSGVLLNPPMACRHPRSPHPLANRLLQAPLADDLGFLTAPICQDRHPESSVQSLLIHTGRQLAPGTTVSERLDCSPPTKTNRVHFPAGSLSDCHKWESCDDAAGQRVSSRISRFPRPFIPAVIHNTLHLHRVSKPCERPRSRSEGAIRETLSRMPRASSLLRASEVWSSVAMQGPVRSSSTVPTCEIVRSQRTRRESSPVGFLRHDHDRRPRPATGLHATVACVSSSFGASASGDQSAGTTAEQRDRDHTALGVVWSLSHQ
ncbi:hypothetical protein PR048_002155 [Dryococelus australis]|uniref:Uncharacterized protein n=1 Tax=Dryococelus australis TaxID=614101 RepID=A0ABQ9IJD6_9NEOP|nr:hypothetical protein PR048_002155 [Dryococelus australis]